MYGKSTQILLQMQVLPMRISCVIKRAVCPQSGHEPSSVVDGPARFIELATGGILRDIMILIRDASRRAIERDLPCLTPDLLENTWRDVQRKRVTDFLELPHKIASEEIR